MPPSRVPPAPTGAELLHHFAMLRRQTLQEAKTNQRRLVGFTRKEKRVLNRQRRLEWQRRLRPLLGEYSIAEVARRSGLPLPTVWKSLTGRSEPKVRVYLRLTRAIQQLNRTPRQVIDLHFLAVRRKPLVT